MKKKFLLTIMLGLSLLVFSMPDNLRAYLSYGTFSTPDNNTYIETYLSIMGKSLTFNRLENGKFQGNVNVTLIFKENDSIREFRKYTIVSQEILDTANISFDLFDQQRIQLANGIYKVELTIQDANSTKAPIKANDIWDVNITDKLGFSSIQFIESFSKASETSIISKSGYDLIPHQDNFFPQSDKKIVFYSELYNAISVFGEDGQFVLTSAITNIENGKPVESYFKQKRETAKKVNVMFNEFDISALPSGNYNLVLTVRDKENNVLATKYSFFQRSNPGVLFNVNDIAALDIASTFVNSYTNKDTLQEYIRMTFPIAVANEKLFINNQLKAAPLKTLQQFFLNFWVKRNSADPASAWKKYYDVVLAVNEEFSCQNNKGYETERGRVYLQYGAPNERIQQTDNPASMPYEIWQYYKTAEQSNVKFVFISRTLATCLYTLVHSTAVGEVINVNWQQQLTRGAPASASKNYDQNLYHKAEEGWSWGEHSGEYFNLEK